MDKKKFNKNPFFIHERVKSSLIRQDKKNELYNDKYLFTNQTNLSTSNTCVFSKFNSFNRNKVLKIKQLDSPLTRKREKLNLKKVSIKQSVETKKLILKKNRENLDQRKYLRGKLCNLMQRHIVLNENQFHPRKFTESISNVHVKGFKNRFKNLDITSKVGIFTNKYPNLLSDGDKFYSRYFDYFESPDEILANNLTKKEIFQIKTEPEYYNIGGSFRGIEFFKKKNLIDILKEEEKIGIDKRMEFEMQRSLRKSKRKIKGYLNYYTHVMSKRGFVYN